MLTEKAREFGGMLGLVTFQYSSGWLEKFKKRFSIKQFQFKGECASASQAIVAECRAEMNKYILEFAAKHGLENIWNLDETALFFRL